VSSFSIEAFEDGRWLNIFDGSTIGFKRIVRFDPVKTDRIRINIKQSLACPVINNVAGFLIPKVKEFKKEFADVD
jgi:alpha-L-fucosidase